MSNKVSSFTSLVKEEIITKPFSSMRLKAMLAAYFKVNGRYFISSKHNRVTIQSENAKIAKFIYVTIDRLYGSTPRFAYIQSQRLQRKMTYQVIIEQKIDRLLNDLGLSFSESIIPERKWITEDEVSGYLAGLFLACGSVNDPESSNYHLEFAVNDNEGASEIKRMLTRIKKISFSSKITQRRNKYILYIKRSDQIANLLIYMGATDSTLEYENIRVARDFINSDNRVQICETANMKKIINAANKQIKDIRFLDDLVGIENINNEKLTHLAKLRLEDDSASMGDLAIKLSKLLNHSVSKSNINHMFRSLHRLAERYRSKQ
jgi:cell division protein WhiA